MKLSALDLSIPSLQRAYHNGASVAGVMTEVMRRADAYGTLDPAVWIARLCEAHVMGFAAALDGLDDEARTAKPLFGIPFAIKDNIDLDGVPTTAGCPGFAATPEASAPIVEKLIAAGAVPIGKTNLDQFATGLVGTRSPYGAPRCVYNSDFISGGSSSGSAVAVAAGLVSFALGTDTAGSGRVPAALNGLVGLKPTPGLCSTTGIVPACASLDCPSIFALSVEDALITLSVMAGEDDADPWSRPGPPCPLPRHTARLGVLADTAREFFGDDEAAALYNAAIERAQAAGHTVETFDYAPFAEAAALLYQGPFVAERYQGVGDALEQGLDGLDETVAGIILGGKDKSAADLFAAQTGLQALRKQAARLFAGLDGLLLPTAPTAYTVADVMADPVTLNSRMGTYTNFVNLMGLAAIAVPAGARDSTGVPFGVTLVGPGGSDFDLASLARTVLPATPVEPMEIAVVGAHLRGQPLNWQLTEKGGQFVRQTLSAPHYRLYAMEAVPPKPALVKSEASDKGEAIELEIWQLPPSEIGALLAQIPAPLGLGTVELIDGSTVKGFIADPTALEIATEITALKRWRTFVGQKA